MIGVRRLLQFDQLPPRLGSLRVAYGLEREPDESDQPKRIQVQILDSRSLVLHRQEDVLDSVPPFGIHVFPVPVQIFETAGSHQIVVQVDGHIASVTHFHIVTPENMV